MATWLADAARQTGYPVIEVNGWRERGHGSFRVIEIVTGHHTATSARAPGDYPSLNIVTNGRAGLAGPLCNYGLGRSGTIYVVAAGVAWHAGASEWAGYRDLNDEAIGIEAESPGHGEWTPAQLDSYPKLVAAVLRYIRRGTDRYCSHRSCALPHGRKPDPTGIADDWMRARAGAAPAGPAPAPVRVPPRPPELTMPAAIVYGKDGLSFRASGICEMSSTSAVYARAWVMLGATWGGIINAKITFLGRDGKPIRQWTGGIANNVRIVQDPPEGVVMVTWEGTLAAPGVIPVAEVVAQVKG